MTGIDYDLHRAYGEFKRTITKGLTMEQRGLAPKKDESEPASEADEEL